MNAFVTGATGFIGSHLVDLLLELGDRVTCLIRDPAKPLPAGVQAIQGDLSDERAIRTATAGADVVFHLAGLTGAWRPSTLDRINREGTARLLAAAAQTAPQARFVYVSSLSAAGPANPGVPRVETDPDAPVSAYGRSKLAAESVVRSYPLPFTIVRPPSVYGPRDAAFLTLFRLARRGWIPMPSALEQELSFIEVRDLARSLVAACAPQCVGRTYFAAHPQIVTAARFAELVHQTLPGRRREPRLIRVPFALTATTLAMSGAVAACRSRTTPLVPDKLSELKAPAWTCSPSALTRDTGWQAKTGLVDGLTSTAHWYLKHRKLVAKG